MFEINKTYLSTKPELTWLANKLDNSFSLAIDDGVSKIVFGYNGIGKTSFSQVLKNENSDELKFLDYESLSQKDGDNSITVSPFITDISRYIKENESIIDEIDIASLAKKQGFAKNKFSSGLQIMKDFARTVKPGKNLSEMKVADSNFSDFITRNNDINPSVYIEIIKYLETITTSQVENDNYNLSKKKEFLDYALTFIDNPDECPVCESDFPNIKDFIENKSNTLAANKSDLIAYMEEKGYDHDTATLDKYIDLHNELKTNPDLFHDFVICGFDLSLHANIITKSANYNNNVTQLTSLSAQKTAKYTEIKNNESRFKKDISKYLKINETNIEFNDTNCEIKITLDREARTYSTGERHILWFLVELYSFIGSNCKTLILDDPASSLDLINMYKIAFEIVKAHEIPSKNLIIFTHSSNLINIINSQNPGLFDIYYIDEFNGNLFCDPIDYRTLRIPNVISIERLASKTPNIFESLRKREIEGYGSDENKVYHFDTTMHSSLIDPTLTNHYLASLIDSFTSFSRVDFYEDSFQKIIYLLGLRVWLEKKLFELIPTTDTTRQQDFLNKDQLQCKIQVICNPANDLFCANGIDKSEIMSKKVMLNQNMHYYSQIMFFAFAMNISFDTLTAEINELKALFH